MRLPVVASKLSYHQRQPQQENHHYDYRYSPRNILTPGARPLEFNTGQTATRKPFGITSNTGNWPHRLNGSRKGKEQVNFGHHASTPRPHKPKLYKPFHYSLQFKIGGYTPPQTAPTRGVPNLRRTSAAQGANSGTVGRKQPIGKVRVRFFCFEASQFIVSPLLLPPPPPPPLPCSSFVLTELVYLSG